MGPASPARTALPPAIDGLAGVSPFCRPPIRGYSVRKVTKTVLSRSCPPRPQGIVMDRDAAIELAKRLLAGDVSPEQFAQAAAPAVSLTEEATVDLDRARRCGFPEVIFAERKSPECVVEIAQKICQAGQNLLATRVDVTQAAPLQQAFPDGVYNSLARTFRWNPVPNSRIARGSVAVVTAGSSDRPVAEEALETLRWMGVATDLIVDVGVAGPQRLLRQTERLRKARVVVVVAGMEGALPSVVGGHVESPIIAVPTSVGYGANLGGVSALLSMLNSCAANVAVVNIDAGFKAGYLAGLIATGSEASS